MSSDKSQKETIEIIEMTDKEFEALLDQDVLDSIEKYNKSTGRVLNVPVDSFSEE